MGTASGGRHDRWVVGSSIGAEWSRTVLNAQLRHRLERVVDLVDLDTSASDAPADLRGLITGWGSSRLDERSLERLPGLEIVLHAAGTLHGLVTPAVWERGIRVVSAADANAVSVADFTVSQIHLALKNAFRLGLAARVRGGRAVRSAVRGLDGATIGLVGLGRVGILVAQRLQDLDVTVLAHDPYAEKSHEGALGLQLTGLNALLASSDVVSLHAPMTVSTRHMIAADELALLPTGATIINTARGGLIDSSSLVDFLRQRPDAFAALDVTDPEPLPIGHPLFSLDNTFITPHIAGSLGTEEARLGTLVVDELERYLSGSPLQYETNEARMALSA